MTQTWTITVEEDPETGDSILPFPDEMIKACGWQEGDTLDFQVVDGAVVLENISLKERQQRV